MTEVTQLALKELSPAPDNIRRKPGDVGELAASIATVGILEPLVVVRNGKGYEVICGSRRLAAAKVAKLTTVPVVVRKLNAQQRVEAMLVENLQRNDVTPLEEAHAYKRLLELGVSQRRLADRIGRSQSHVSKRLLLLELPALAARQLDSGRITIEDALELTKLKDHPDRIAEALKPTLYDRSIKDRVKRIEQQAADHAKVEAAREELERQGVKLIPYAKVGYGKSIKRIGKGYDADLTIEVNRHQTEPCHAATVVDVGHYDSGKKIFLCTEPKRHGPTGESKIKSDDATRAARETRAHQKELERAKELKAARVEREAFVDELLDRRIARDDVVEQIVRALADQAGAVVNATAAQMLGLEEIKDKHTTSLYWGFKEAISRHLANASPAELLKTGLALALAHGTLRLRGSYPQYATTEWHLKFLKAQGYKISAAERDEIARKKKGRW